MLSVDHALSAFTRRFILALKRLVSLIGLKRLWSFLASILRCFRSGGEVDGEGGQREDTTYSLGVASLIQETTAACSQSPDGYPLESLGRLSDSPSRLPSAPSDLTPCTVPETDGITEGQLTNIVERIEVPLEVGTSTELDGSQNNGDSDMHLLLETTHPTQLKRYDREVKLPRSTPLWEIEPLAMHNAFTLEKAPLGWHPCIHPEGMLYYRGEICLMIYGTLQNLIFLTDANVCDANIHGEIEKIVQKIKAKIEEHKDHLKTKVKFLEVVLERATTIDNKKKLWQYYIVQRSSRHIFWLDEHKVEPNVYQGAASEEHIGRWIKAEYYQHLTFFPHGQDLGENFFDEMRGILSWGLTDSLTSLDSLTPYDEATMDRFLKLIKSMQAVKTTAPEYCVAAGARLRMVFETSRFDNFSGLSCARLSRTQSLRGEVSRDQTKLFRLFSLFFFNTPKKYTKLLNGIYVDRIVFQAPFRQFVERATSGWQQDVINAAVLFNANIAFLAIPPVLPQNGEISAPATASIVSITLSLSSVIFGQLLGKRLQALLQEQTPQVADYFFEWWGTERGPYGLALMYSLPYTLMIWGAVSFILAIFLFAFGHLKLNAQILVIATFLVAAILSCVWVVFQIHNWFRPMGVCVRMVWAPVRTLLGVKPKETQELPNRRILQRKLTITFDKVGRGVLSVGRFIRNIKGRRDQASVLTTV